MNSVNEIAHVMFKPETLAIGIRDTILREIISVAGTPRMSRRLVLCYPQICAIYPDFPNKRARPFVFKYFTSLESEHFAFVGTPGIHQILHSVKGATGTGIGIRGKYYTNYTRLTEVDLDRWLEGTLPNESDIDLEMFGRDILHVADHEIDSLRGLTSIFGEEEIRQLR